MKKILETLRKKWAEYLLEILVITIGVLGAFALNNWNEGIKADVRKQQLLKSLKTEFQNNLDALNTTMDYDSLLMLDIDKLLSRMNSDNEDSLDYLVGRTLITWTFDPSNGAVRTAIATGEIYLIYNRELLSKLLSWEDLIVDLYEEQSRLNSEQREMVKKFSGNYRVGNALNALGGGFPKSKFDPINTLLSNPEFEASLLDRRMLLSAKTQETRVIRRVNKEILELIEAELE